MMNPTINFDSIFLKPGEFTGIFENQSVMWRICLSNGILKTIKVILHVEQVPKLFTTVHPGGAVRCNGNVSSGECQGRRRYEGSWGC